MEPDTIFIKNGAPVYKGTAKAVREILSIKGFSNSWPPSSLNLNPIKKI